MKKRKRHCVIRFHKEKKELEYQYRNLLMLYFPWRDEVADLKGDFAFFEEHYQSDRDTVNAEELERAYSDLQRMGPPEDAWDGVDPT